MIADLFKFNEDDHSLIYTHFRQLQTQVDTKEYSSLHSKTNNSSQYTASVNNLIGQDAPREIKKAAVVAKRTFE